MGTITKLPSGSFRVRIRRQGAPTVSRTFPSRKEAERWESQQETAISHGSPLPLSVRDFHSANQVTFADLAERYLTSIHFTSKRPKTQRGERIKLPHLLRRLGEYAITRISAPVIVAYRDARMAERTAKGTPVSRDTVRLELALLSVILDLAAGEWQLIPANPCRGIKKPVGVARDRRLSEEEEKRLRVVLMRRRDPRLLWFFLVAYYTGMRSGEIAELRKEWFHREKRCLDLPGKATKNSKAKRIPLTDEAYNVLIHALENAEPDSPYVFASKSREGAYRPYDYGCAWNRVRKRAGLGDLRFHDLRHEFVSRLFERTNLSDGQIASLTGHGDPRSLWRYKHLRAELLRPAIQEVNRMLVNREMMREIEQEIDYRSDPDYFRGVHAMSAINSEQEPDWDFLLAVFSGEEIEELKQRRAEIAEWKAEQEQKERRREEAPEEDGGGPDSEGENRIEGDFCFQIL
jgi:integrase